MVVIVIVLLVYPVKNYSAIANLTRSHEGVEKVEKTVAQEETETLPGKLLFKY